MPILYWTTHSPQRIHAHMLASKNLRANAVLKVYAVPGTEYHVWSSTAIPKSLIDAMHLELVLEQPLVPLNVVSLTGD